MISKHVYSAVACCLVAVALGAPASAATRSQHSAKQRTAGKPAPHRIAVRAKVRQTLVLRSAKPGRRPLALAVVRAEPARPSFGQLYGLHDAADSLELKSGVALVVDQDTNEVLFSKNSQAVLPIASLTKLMTALVVADAHLPLGEVITVTDDDIDTEKGSRSRLRIGTQLRREEMLHLALMSSENRAAHALGRSYPGGIDAFVTAMNAKARSLGMADTRYVEPTGLSSLNQSSARDLATLVRAAHEVPLIRELSTSVEYQVEVGNRQLQFHNTNGLVKNPLWDIGLQKPAISRKPAAASSCKPSSRVVNSSWCFSTRQASNRGSATLNGCATG